MRTKIVSWICFLTIIAIITGCSKTQDKEEISDEEVSKGSYVEQKVLQPTLELGEEQGFNSDEEVSKGSYIEQEALHPTMESGERRVNIAVNDHNQLEYYTVKSTEDFLNSTYNCYTLVDGHYQKESVEWANKASSEISFDPVEYCHGQDGYDYILYTKPLTFTSDGQVEIDKMEYGVIKEVEDSKGYVDVTPAHWNQGTIFRKLQVTKGGMLCYLIYQDEKLEFYDPVKQEKAGYGNFKSNQDYVIQGDMLYYIPADTKELQIIQLSENKIEKIELESNPITTDFEVSKEGDVILLDDLGIHQYKKGGTIWETIAEGRQLPGVLVITDFVLIPGTYDTYYAIYLNEDLFLAYQFVEN